ncbi:telomerase Cajal body protein 1-like [Triticum dicoccoides]|uniref:telomerase Cajal body protein 1-like n=1 Tax=Triticum dicoccoides TaxID=85692 RepID=UPI00189049C4|nr:telomerase Cajal body protein 1-like [Triticum dicoccoides]
MLAVGPYSQTTAVYAEGNMEPLYVLHGQLGGVTQVLFLKDGNYLYTGGRKDPYILCWDIRNTVDIVYKLYRSCDTTNQRVQFDTEPCGKHLATGGQVMRTAALSGSFLAHKNLETTSNPELWWEWDR